MQKKYTATDEAFFTSAGTKIKPPEKAIQEVEANTKHLYPDICLKIFQKLT